MSPKTIQNPKRQVFLGTAVLASNDLNFGCSQQRPKHEPSGRSRYSMFFCSLALILTEIMSITKVQIMLNRLERVDLSMLTPGQILLCKKTTKIATFKTVIIHATCEGNCFGVVVAKLLQEDENGCG